MSKTDGGPAFPVVITDTGEPQKFYLGMTMRDIFAMAAVGMAYRTQRRLSTKAASECTAIVAYAIADAMLAERDK